MDRLELAIRRYKQIVPDAAHHAVVPFRSLGVWLTQYVVPALEPVVSLPQFRELASWPVRTYREGAQSPQAQLVRALEEGIRETSKQFLKVARVEPVRTQLIAQNPRREVASETITTFSTPGIKRQVTKRGQFDALKAGLAMLEQLAVGSLPRFTNVNDFLSPQSEWKRVGKKVIQRSSSIVSLNVELPTIGDFVTRRLEGRLDEQLQVLTWIRTALNKALASTKNRTRYRGIWKTAETRYMRVVASVKELRHLLLKDPDRHIRESCICAVQIYAAFSESPDLGWLGLERRAHEQSRMALRGRVTQFRNAELFDRIANILHELKPFGSSVSPAETELLRAIAGGGLVVDEGMAKAYWDAKEILPPLKLQAFRFLLALATNAGRHQAVSVRDLSDEATARSFMSTAWQRLKKSLPPSLHKLVLPGLLNETYVLKLEANRVHIFETLSSK